MSNVPHPGTRGKQSVRIVAGSRTAKRRALAHRMHKARVTGISALIRLEGQASILGTVMLNTV